MRIVVARMHGGQPLSASLAGCAHRYCWPTASSRRHRPFRCQPSSCRGSNHQRRCTDPAPSWANASLPRVMASTCERTLITPRTAREAYRRREVKDGPVDFRGGLVSEDIVDDGPEFRFACLANLVE